MRVTSRSGVRCKAISIHWRAPAATALDRASMRSSKCLADGPFIFNLGHGILPDTPIAHVEQMLRRVRRTCGDPIIDPSRRGRVDEVSIKVTLETADP